MGNDLILGLVLTLVVLVFLFFIFRELNNWYWKINERISIAHKTNFLLERIAIQLGASNSDSIIIEEIATGVRRKMSMDEWTEMKKKYNTKGFRIVKEE